MANNKGQWILLEEGASTLLTLGVPRVGDPIRLDYDERFRKWQGIAKRIKTANEPLREAAKSPEYGMDLIYSGVFSI